MLDSILWVGPSRGDMAGTQPRQQTDGAPRRDDHGAEAGDPLVLYKYNGNLLHLSAVSWLEFAACGMDCRGHKSFCLHAETENLPAESYLLPNRENRRVTKRESLLQYLHYGHVSRRLGDFEAHFVAGYVLCSRKPIPPNSFNAPSMGRTD